MKHGEEGTHSVCNKHFALLGGKSTCCVCGEKKDCSNTPSPKPCCAFSGKKCCDKCRYPYQEKGVDCEHTAACNFCPCHQPKPEVSPEKKEKCEDSQCFDANCSTHGIHPTPPEKEEKCICEGELKHEDVKHSKDNCYWMRSTLPEQKGEWEEELEKAFHGYICQKDTNEVYLYAGEVVAPLGKLKDFIAAKKEKWEAQKEQAVKAEIRERIEKMNGIDEVVTSELKNGGKLTRCETLLLKSDLLSLLSDKVNPLS